MFSNFFLRKRISENFHILFGLEINYTSVRSSVCLEINYTSVVVSVQDI